MRIRIFGVLTLGLLLQGCSAPGEVKQRELIIAPAPVPCAGAPPATCLSASEPSGDTWLMRFDEIQGFTYEPGFTYRVLIDEPPVNQELAVVPRLALIRVVSKEPGGGVASPLGHGAWRLQSMSGTDQVEADEKITASFHGGGWVDGFAGCDHYIGALAVDGEKITVSPPAVGAALCARAVQDRQRTYLEALAKAQSFSVSRDSLELALADGGTMRFRASGER